MPEKELHAGLAWVEIEESRRAKYFKIDSRRKVLLFKL
jgi:hypothetical protein